MVKVKKLKLSRFNTSGGRVIFILYPSPNSGKTDLTTASLFSYVPKAVSTGVMSTSCILMPICAASLRTVWCDSRSMSRACVKGW